MGLYDVTALERVIETDLVNPATAIIPNDVGKRAIFFKVPLNAESFFVKRHTKLGPSAFAIDGVFLRYRVIQ